MCEILKYDITEIEQDQNEQWYQTSRNEHQKNVNIYNKEMWTIKVLQIKQLVTPTKFTTEILHYIVHYTKDEQCNQSHKVCTDIINRKGNVPDKQNRQEIMHF